MDVKNKIMFHITTCRNWEVGNIIMSGQKENCFWLKCKKYAPEVTVNEQVMPLFKMFDLYPTFDATHNNIDFLYENLKVVSKETALYIREQVFEEVRRDQFPQLPSRQKCLWVTEEDQIPFWKTMRPDTQRLLLTLRLNGDIFCGDAYWLAANTFSSIEYAERANHYWANEMSATPKKEFLFYGDAMIEDIVSIE